MGACIALCPSLSLSGQPKAHPLERKAAGLFFLNMSWKSPPGFFKKIIERYQPAGVYLDAAACQDKDTLKLAVSKLREAGGERLLFITDFESKQVNRLRRIKKLPSPSEIGRDLDRKKISDDDLNRHFRDKAALLSRLGFDMNFDPALDLSGPMIGGRSYGDDPSLVARVAAAALRGYGEAGVHAIVKHFPGLGGTRKDPHQEVMPRIAAKLNDLVARDLIPFAAAFKQGAPAVLVAHVMVEAVDKKWPASFSSTLINGLLREDMGFPGVVWPDSLSMGAVKKFFKERGVKPDRVDSEASIAAIRAGCDLIFNFRFDNSRFPALMADVRRSVERGVIPEARLDKALARVKALRG